MIIYKLKDIPKSVYDVIGGKARGLRELINAGLNVPDGFVITDMNREEDFPFAVEYYSRSGLKNVIVRSSATGEDGDAFSAAGQYETVLNVSDKQKLLVAIKKCIKSLKSDTATAYCNTFPGAKSSKMALVIQSMIDAKFSGICFSKNPVNGKCEIVIEATKGLSDELTAGKAKPRRYRAAYREEDGNIIDIDPVNISEGAKLISHQELALICKDVAKAVNKFGHHLSLEWAIDKSGTIHWLQAGSITTLDSASLCEFDGLKGDEETVFCNCVETDILPSVVTPLTLSTTVNALDASIRTSLIRSGAYTRQKQLPPNSCIASFNGHLFLNLSPIYKVTTDVARMHKDDIENCICGKTLNTPYQTDKKNFFKRQFNGLKFAFFFMSRKRAMKKIEQLYSSLVIKESDDIIEFYDNINAKIDQLTKASLYYLVTCIHFGIMNRSLFKSVCLSAKDDTERAEIFGNLLSEIEGMDEASLTQSMRKIALEIVRKYPAAADFSAEKLLDIVKTDDKKIEEAFEEFMLLHGCRAIKGSELRNLAWKYNERFLMDNILSIIKAGVEEEPKKSPIFEFAKKKFLKSKKFTKRLPLKYLIKQARLGVYSKEYARFRYIKIVDIFKDAYKMLGEKMAAAGIISDADLVYFLSHAELGKLIVDNELGMVKKAVQRRKISFEQNELKYKDVIIGTPKPIRNEDLQTLDVSVLSGTPVSHGEVSGIAKIVKNLDDARALVDGEIMITKYADTSWSPYFSKARGMICEIGSSLSHGAVVAREYGLPLVVNVADALSLIKNGDHIHLNGAKGIVTIIKP